jgi:RNA polymerase sigma-70 factor (ECF subfamily)
MADCFDLDTSTTLLCMLRHNPTDSSAWDRFVDRYAPLIYRWCRQWGLQEADAEDVTQNILLELLRQMRTFVYDPAGSFRAWLRTVAYRGWCRFVGSRRRAEAGDTAAGLEMLQSESAGEDFLRQLEQESDRELLERAMAVVRPRVQPHTWEAFWLLAVAGRSGAEAAAQLDMKVGTVFVARSKVQKMLREEIQRLTGDGAP